jgi:uncharacterized protein YkwD
VTAKATLCVEALELRDCPATANLFNGVLTVQGTSGNDSITIARSGNWVSVAGQSFSFWSFSRVVVTTGGGDDVIVDLTDKSAVIYGGDGNDTIRGGTGRDKIYGGRGNDDIKGGRGDDTIYGGGGTDTLGGGAGTNVLIEGSPTAVRANTAFEAQIVDLVNSHRAANGLPPLAVSGLLTVAADFHSRDMAVIGGTYGPSVGMQHTLFGTTRPEVTDRLDAAGYDNWTSSFAWGENIAYGFTSAAAVMSAWMGSPGHRANILSTSFTEFGVSVQAAANGQLYFTQVFGRLT